MRGWLRSALPIALLLAVWFGASDVEAQRRRGRRSRPTRVDTSTPAESSGAPSTPPPDPFADDAVAPAPGGPRASEAPATTTAPSVSGAPQSEAGMSTGATSASASAPVSAPSRDSGPLPPDLAPIRQEYVQLMDEMVQARSRVAIVSQELFQTRMTITVQDRTGDEQMLTRFLLELDGTPVHRTDGELEGGEQGRQVFEGALAPGPHVLTIDREQRARDDPEYRTMQRESFRFIVVRDRLNEVTIILEDDSDIARQFPAGGEGRFDVRTRVRVATRELPRS